MGSYSYSEEDFASKIQVDVEKDGCPLYEPLLGHDHDHRGNTKVFGETKIQHPPHTGTSFLRTLLNGVNALSGVGILSIPYALSEGGWLSLILLFMVAMICCYTGLLLKRCMDVSPSIRSYSDIGELAFGNKGRILIAVFMYLELYLVAIEFIILESDNLNKLLPNMSFKVFELTIAGKQGFILIAALVILPTTWLRSMGLLAYISAGGALASIVVVVSVLWAGTVDGVGFHGEGKLINLSGFPTAVSLYAFCYCGHAVFPTIYTSMKDRSQFSKWDILASGGTVEETANLATGREPGNSISLLHVNSLKANHTNMVILQECCTDPTGSLVTYAPVDIGSMNMVLNCGDPDYVALLPSGFSHFPDGTGGSLLTVAFQILVDSVPTAKLCLASITAVNSLISSTVGKMKALIREKA